jgi:hypothetical protein
MQFSPVPCYFLCLKPKYPPQHSILEHHQPMRDLCFVSEVVLNVSIITSYNSDVLTTLRIYHLPQTKCNVVPLISETPYHENLWVSGRTTPFFASFEVFTASCGIWRSVISYRKGIVNSVLNLSTR